MTSDEFFSQNVETFDVVFVDGLHEYDQVRRDVQNSLEVLNPGGVIVMHDCLPTTYAAHANPPQQAAWNGDVWRLVFELKERSDIDVRVVSIDHGCGIILPRPRTDSISVTSSDWGDAEFGVYAEHWKQLGIIDYPALVSWVTEYAADPS